MLKINKAPRYEAIALDSERGYTGNPIVCSHKPPSSDHPDLARLPYGHVVVDLQDGTVTLDGVNWYSNLAEARKRSGHLE